MAFWITTHWPQREDRRADEPHYGVWVQDDKLHLIDRVSPEDLVFIYESQSGRTQIRKFVDGTTRRIGCHLGRGGIVALVKVTERASQPEESEWEKYADGTSLWWRYCAPTESVNSAGFLSRQETNRILGYSDKNVFRGFGEEHSGLKEISHELFDRVYSAFMVSALRDEQARVANAPTPRFGGGGEGPEHLALKMRIAADPAGVLGEPGLALWDKEFRLPHSRSNRPRLERPSGALCGRRGRSLL